MYFTLALVEHSRQQQQKTHKKNTLNRLHNYCKQSYGVIIVSDNVPKQHKSNAYTLQK